MPESLRTYRDPALTDRVREHMALIDADDVDFACDDDADDDGDDGDVTAVDEARYRRPRIVRAGD